MVFLIEYFVLATSYSPFSSTIASTELNFRVRNENGCDLCDKSPKQKIQFFHILYYVLNDGVDAMSTEFHVRGLSRKGPETFLPTRLMSQE